MYILYVMRLLNTVIIFVASLNYMIREVKKNFSVLGFPNAFQGLISVASALTLIF